MADAAELDVDGMSDEELMALPEDPSSGMLESVDEDASLNADDTQETDDNEGEESEAESEEDTTEEDESSEDDEDDGTDVGADDVESSADGDTDSEDEAEEIVDKLDYESEYKKLLAPFKANGRDMQIENVDDAIRLMSMGANYNKKMAAMKPQLKLLKMLSNNDILDESKLNYLIDLSKNDHGAVKQLVKESGIDTETFDEETNTDYTPNTYTVNDTEIELDTVLREIEGTDGYNTTMDLVSNKWDEASTVRMINNPSLITAINNQIGSGIYDQISAVMDREKALGRLAGLSDLDAYKAVGDHMQANNLFKEVAPPASQNELVIPKIVTKKQPDPKLASRRKAASPAKSATAKEKGLTGINPLDMSDEEFEKMAAKLI